MNISEKQEEKVNKYMLAQDVRLDYDEVLQRCKPSFRKKLIHSVELLQKAEKLALRYDAEDGFFMAFSGGKDSQALYNVAVLGG